MISLSWPTTCISFRVQLGLKPRLEAEVKQNHSQDNTVGFQGSTVGGSFKLRTLTGVLAPNWFNVVFIQEKNYFDASCFKFIELKVQKYRFLTQNS